jgi:L-asparaginase II
MLIEPSPTADAASVLAQERRRGMQPTYPENPILVRRWRGGRVESVHRGAWVLVDSSGTVLDGLGDVEFPIFARSSTKALQALPLIESGAAERFRFDSEETALAVASHNGEACHTRVVERLLTRLGLSVADLRCGAHRPYDSDTAFEMRKSGAQATALHNNCSGKHAGFLALAKHLDVPPEAYLDPESESQCRIHRAVLEMTGTRPGQLSTAIDGCSAPTFRLPLRNLALGFARFANPAGLESERRAACERLAAAAARHPELIGGTQGQICSAISRATGGRLFPKIGAEAVYVIGERGGERALALKMDDGEKLGLHPLVLHLLRRLGLARDEELEALSTWAAGPIRNWAGLEVGRTEVVE